MGNVRSISCPELRISLSVGKGIVWTGKDNRGRDRIWLLSQFLETCMGKTLIYHDEQNEDDIRALDDIQFAEFEDGRDYTTNPITEKDLEPVDGWAIPTDRQMDAVTEATATGQLGHVTGMTVTTDSFREPIKAGPYDGIRAPDLT